MAGPMTGIPSNNVPAFDAAADRLRALGHDVVNPADLNREMGHDPREQTPPHMYGEFMRADLKALLGVEAVVVLPGWGRSRGARLETDVARAIGIPIYELADVLGEVAA